MRAGQTGTSRIGFPRGRLNLFKSSPNLSIDDLESLQTESNFSNKKGEVITPPFSKSSLLLKYVSHRSRDVHIGFFETSQKIAI